MSWRSPHPVPARRQKLAALVLLALYFPSAGLGFAYGASARPTGPPAVYAVDAHHHVLGSGARLRPGQQVTIYARGFAEQAPVQTVDANRRLIGHVRADRTGVAQLVFRVPVHLAPRRGRFVALDGRMDESRLRSDAASALPSGPVTDGQAVEVTVPLLRRFAYRVGRSGHGVEGVGVGSGSGSHGGGGLASTGLNVLALMAAGVLLLVLGAVVLKSTRRRPTATVSRRRARATALRLPRGSR